MFFTIHLHMKTKLFIINHLEGNPVVHNNGGKFFDTVGLGQFILEHKLEPDTYLIGTRTPKDETLKSIEVLFDQEVPHVNEEAPDDDAFFLILDIDTNPVIVTDKTNKPRKFYYEDAYWYLKDHNILDGTFKIVLLDASFMDYAFLAEQFNWKVPKAA